MYFPDQYYVTLEPRAAVDSVPLGYPVPDGDDTAAKKRKETANPAYDKIVNDHLISVANGSVPRRTAMLRCQLALSERT